MKRMQILKNIFWVAGAPWGTLGNAYLIKYSQGYILLDCSRPNALPNIIRNLDYWNIEKEKISHILLTHGHDDHVGEAAYFKEIGAKIVVGKADAQLLKLGTLGEENPCTNHVMPPVVPDILIGEDRTIEIAELTFTIHCVPGHTDGSLIYLLNMENQLILFAGDMFYIEGKYGEEVLTGWKGDLSYNSKKLGESFKKIYAKKYAPDIVLTGHGIPRFGKDAECIKMAYRYYLKNDR